MVATSLTPLAAIPAIAASLDLVERAIEHVLPGREQQLPRHGPREIAIGLLDQPAILVIEHVAVERQLVGVAGFAQEMRRLPDQVEREIGEAEIDLERRRMAAPFAQALPEHQRIVAQPLAIIGARRLMRVDHRRVERPAIGRGARVPHLVFFDHRKAGHQMCVTTSGMS